MKKILIVYATAGIGHTKAALAVKDALDEKGEGFSYEVVDILDYTNAFLKWLYHRFYIILVSDFPFIWGAVYHFLDIPCVYNCIKGLRKLMNRMNSKKFTDYLNRTKPDIVVSTHFFSSEVVSCLKGKGIINPYLITIITDFKRHMYWITKETDLYIIGSEILREQLKLRGIEEQKIKILGLPIEQKYYKRLDIDALYKKFDIQKDSFTIVIASGGFGVGPVEKIAKELMAANLPIQLIVVCGKNSSLRQAMEKIQKKSSMPMKVYGFVDNIHELMEVADLLISKSGGMTASEALAKELPMMITSPIPGQEMRNCEFLTENGVALREDNPSLIRKKVTKLFSNKEDLDSMKNNIRCIKKSNPAINLINLMKEL